MTIYLILAHRDIGHVEALVESLVPSKIVMHVDSKSKIGKRELKQIASYPNVLVVNSQDSINIRWGGFSQIAAMWVLLNTALKLLQPNEKMVFLSGSDFPLKAIEDIELELAQFDGVELMRYFFLDERKKDQDRWQKYHRWDWRFFKARGTLLCRANSLALRVLTVFETALRGRKVAPQFRIASSSTWFAISKECGEELKQMRNHKFDTFFRTVYAPDELYFATLFHMSSFSKRNLDRGDFHTNANQSRIWQVRNFTYVDASLDHFLTLKDLTLLEQSEFLFARKFDSNISKELRDLLLKRLSP
jgi:hypothetical protein